MRVHLRLSRKDADLCRWKESVKYRLLNYWILQILYAEMNDECVRIPVDRKTSFKTSPCEITLRIPEGDVLEAYIKAIPQQQRNARIKGIIRKHLLAQEHPDRIDIQNKNYSISRNVDIKMTRPPKSQIPDSLSVKESLPVQKVYEESEEDRTAILALIAMSGE